MRKKVLVLLPIFGEAPHLEVALESILAQSFNDWNLVAVLDRPTDSLRSRLAVLGTFQGRLRVVESLRPGISEALNAGVLVEDCDFLARIDADDWMESDRLSRQVDFLEENPNVVCVGSQTRNIDVEGRPIEVSKLPTSQAQVRAMMQDFNVISHPSTMIRASALRQVGGYDKRFDGAEDYHLWLRLLRIGDIQNLVEALTNYRVHENQISRQSDSTLGLLECLVRLDVEGGEIPGFDTPILARIKNKGPLEFWDEAVRLERTVPWSARRRLVFARLFGRAIREKGFTKLWFMTSAFLANPVRYAKISSHVWSTRLAEHFCR